MKAKDLNLAKELDFNPKEGMLDLGSQRMITMPSDSMGKLIDFIMDIADENMVYMFFFRMGQEAGRKDAQNVKESFNPDSVKDWFKFAPAMMSWEGLVKPILEEVEFDKESGGLSFMKAKMLDSFFADQWLDKFGEVDHPVCSFLTGHASGYCSEVFGKELKAKEVKCRGQGDDVCAFEMRPKEEW